VHLVGYYNIDVEALRYSFGARFQSKHPLLHCMKVLKIHNFNVNSLFLKVLINLYCYTSSQTITFRLRNGHYLLSDVHFRSYLRKIFILVFRHNTLSALPKYFKLPSLRTCIHTYMYVPEHV
jgi:hypothetical protein